MRFVAFSDFHAHNFAFGARSVEIEGYAGLYNSRLRDAVMCLRHVREHCQAHNISLVLFGGDLYHSRKSVTTDVRYIVTKEIEQFSKSGIDLVMIPGNHDMGDKEGYVHHLSGLREFEGMALVVDKPRVVQYQESLDIACLPYVEEVDKLVTHLARVQEYKRRDVPLVLLSHIGFQGAKVGSDYVLVKDTDMSTNQVPNIFDLCLFGHYHQHQRLFKNGYYIGATHQHNWGCAGGKRGFVDCEVEQGSYRLAHHEIPSAPRFWKLKEGDDMSCVREQDFVQYQGEAWEGPEAARVDLVTKSKKAEDVDLDTSQLDPYGVLERWVAAKAPEDERKSLLDLGHQILQRSEK